ncbi:hypothetical protein ACQ4PT_054767 [Festuca glaucescens]
MGGKTIQVSGFRRADSADKVKDLLERVAGASTVYATKLRHPRNTSGTSRPFAIVQFQTEGHASSLLQRATQRNVLRIGGYYLKVRPAEHDIVQRPRTAIFNLRDDAAVLHFGCLLSQGEMSVLWSTGRGVSVEFGFGMKKIYFYLLHDSKNYKLELSYESIWEIQLYLPPSLWSQTKFLVIQVQAAPKIYERSMPCSSAPNFFNYFRDGKDDQWTRTTDFTPSASIGQSYIMCLEVPYLCDLPNIDDYCAYYTTHNSDFHCRRGYPYSCHSRFVPIVKSYYYTDIPYEILFKINHMVQNGILSGPTLDESFFRSVSPSFEHIDHIKLALEKMLYRKRTCLNPTSWLSEQYSKFRRSRSRITSPYISLDDDDGLVRVYRVQVTPAKMYFYDPEINVSNRVIRHYAADLENFLRISFVDEDFEKRRSADISPRSASRRTALYDRILSVLSDGITIGDKTFEFLAFSSSQLRDNSAWMFASRPGLSASGIRQWMGNFAGIRNVAKYAARLGQSFSASTETLKVEKYEVEEIPDIKNGTKYDFSDGIGKISADCAKQVAMKCKLNRFTPSAFQIRYGGYKGVVAVDPGSQWKLTLRKSMLKFESENITLDVLAYSKYQPCFLNRQLITLLSTLGVRDNIFELKQREAVERLNRMITEPQAAIEAVELMPMGEISNTLKGLLCGGYQPDLEPFLSMVLQTVRAFKLLELKMKSRILIPQGRAMMGCLDETRTLRYGEQGPRPHPNECSGSDLDGDIYFVSWDPDLIPTRMMAPMDYTPAPTEELDHDVRLEEVHEYFANYIVNESLGMIANAHVVFADKDPLKAESEPCIELAKLFSVAVDFPKTGVPAQIPPHLHVKEYPDFMEKHDKETYVSNGVIGKLYREIKWQNPRVDHFTKDVAQLSYDTDLIVDGYQYHIEEAEQFKEDYDVKLGNLMDHYGIKTEAEIIRGCVLMMAKNFSRSSDNEAVAGAVRSLRREARSWFGETEDEDEDWRCVQEAKASAWYHVTYHQEYWGRYNQDYARPHLISFPWCVCDMLLNIKHRRMRRKRTKT